MYFLPNITANSAEICYDGYGVKGSPFANF